VLSVDAEAAEWYSEFSIILCRDINLCQPKFTMLMILDSSAGVCPKAL
jgi:hypothetical protein